MRSRLASLHSLALAGRAVAVALALAGCAVAVEDEGAVSAAEQALIFGNDERQEYGAASAAHQRWSRSVAMLVSRNMINCVGTSCGLTAQPWVEDMDSGERLCSDVRFRGQSTLAFGPPEWGGYCSGFLVAPDLIATAAHCVLFDVPDCSQMGFVFGYNANASGGGIPSSVPQTDVYHCASITPADDADWALVKLDRPVAGRPPLHVRRSGAVANNTPLVIIGHPNGLPMKISPSGNVRATSDPVAFSHNIDSFMGNSGCPVFERDSGVVEGIHVQAPPGTFHFADDIDENGPCVSEWICSTTGCPATAPGGPPSFSAAIRMTQLSDRIPLIPALIYVATQNPA